MMTMPLASRSAQADISTVSLRQVFPEAEFRGCPDLVVSGYCTDSGRVMPGQVFVAIDGTEDGAARAVDRGASAIIAERTLDRGGAKQVIVSDIRTALARLAQELAGNPSRWLPVVGVTGLSGKTAASLFLRAILEADGRRVSAIRGADAHAMRGVDASRLAAELNAVLDRRSDLAILNLSAEALADRVADGVLMDAALICPGRPLVLPTSGDGRSALRAMARMTRSVRPGGAIVVEAGDPENGLLAASNLAARVVTYGVGELGDVTAVVEDRDLDGTRFRIRGLDRERTVRLRPIGEPALLASLGAAAVAREYGASDGAIVAGLESVACVPGWLEPIASGARHRVVADRAESGRSLRNAARTLRERVSGELIAVLAVTADPARAAEVVTAAESEGLRVILTRAEPESIVSDMESTLGRFRQPGRVRVCPDRRQALETAMEMCGPEDVVVLLGATSNSWQSDAAIVQSWIRRDQPVLRRSA